MKISKKEIDFYKENGYLHLKNFFTSEEVESFKKGCDLNEYGDTLVRKDFLEFSISNKMLVVIKTLLESDRIIYPCLSQTRTNDKCKLNMRYYHVDSHPDDMDYSKKYNVLNTGIYLQNHSTLSGGLKIKPKSHNYKCIEVKSIIGYVKEVFLHTLKLDAQTLRDLLRRSYSKNIPTCERDLLIWNMRTHHSGYYVRLKGLPNVSLSPLIENLIPKFLKQPEPENRRVVLTAYASPGPYTEMWLDEQSKKERRKAHYSASMKLRELYFKNLFLEKNLEIRNI